MIYDKSYKAKKKLCLQNQFISNYYYWIFYYIFLKLFISSYSNIMSNQCNGQFKMRLFAI